MGAQAGQGRTYDLPNFVGELFRLTPSETPFLSMIGGLNGGRSVSSTQFTWQTVDNTAAAQPSIQEGADPTYESRTRSEVVNVTQIFQYGLELSYTKMAATGQLGGEAILGLSQPVQDEAAFQLQLKVERAARDVEVSFLEGVYQDNTAYGSPRQTRGVVTAITSNSVDASSADFERSDLQTLVRTMVDTNNAPLRRPVLMVGAFNTQRISDIYGFAPDSRTMGGVAINTIMADLVGNLPVVYNRNLTASTMALVDVSVCRPVMLAIPKKGHFFVEPIAASGASDKWQLYGEIGLEYGPEAWHGEIINTTTS